MLKIVFYSDELNSYVKGFTENGFELTEKPENATNFGFAPKFIRRMIMKQAEQVLYADLRERRLEFMHVIMSAQVNIGDVDDNPNPFV